jgi:hypothetical protein
MPENEKISPLVGDTEHINSPSHPENIDDVKNQIPDPYPNQEKREGADNEQYIINNANGNGINPNPIESGNEPDWLDGRKQNDDYLRDASE